MRLFVGLWGASQKLKSRDAVPDHIKQSAEKGELVLDLTGFVSTDFQMTVVGAGGDPILTAWHDSKDINQWKTIRIGTHDYWCNLELGKVRQCCPHLRQIEFVKTQGPVRLNTRFMGKEIIRLIEEKKVDIIAPRFILDRIGGVGFDVHYRMVEKPESERKSLDDLLATLQAENSVWSLGAGG